MSRLEAFYNQHTSYRGAKLPELEIGHESQSYYFKPTHLPDENYSIKAIPKGHQNKDLCGNLWLDETGHRGARKAACW